MARKTLLESMKYVEPHQSGVRYKRRIPVRLRPDFNNKTSWVRNFPKGASEVEIVRSVNMLSAKHDALIRAARGRRLSDSEKARVEFDAMIWTETSTDEEIREMLEKFLASKGGASKLTAEERGYVSAVENKGKVPSEGSILSVAAVEDAARYGQGRNPRPFDYAVSMFIDAVGDKRITDITRADVAALIAARADLSPATLVRAIGTLRGLVNRAYRDLEIDKRNPFADHQIQGSGGGASDKLPFTRAMLACIDQHLATSTRMDPETRNIMRLMKGTGTGPAEASGLAVADVSLGGEVPYISIRKNRIRRIKDKDQGSNSVRDRQIPLIGEALEAVRDALTHIEDRALGNDPEDVALFSLFGLHDRGADNISQKVNRTIRVAGVPNSPRLTGYSFRHTIKEALRTAGVSEHVQRRLMGHSGEGVANRYGSKHGKLSELRDALVAALPHLGDIDRANYTSDEWVD